MCLVTFIYVLLDYTNTIKRSLGYIGYILVRYHTNAEDYLQVSHLLVESKILARETMVGVQIVFFFVFFFSVCVCV